MVSKKEVKMVDLKGCRLEYQMASMTEAKKADLMVHQMEHRKEHL